MLARNTTIAKKSGPNAIIAFDMAAAPPACIAVIASGSSIVSVPATIAYETPAAMNMFIPEVIPYLVIVSSRYMIISAPIAICATTRGISCRRTRQAHSRYKRI